MRSDTQAPAPDAPNYGATQGAPPGDGMQRLGADASKIEPKVSEDNLLAA